MNARCKAFLETIREEIKDGATPEQILMLIDDWLNPDPVNPPGSGGQF